MKWHFSRQGLKGRARWLERAFEILPGATSWTLLLGLAALAWWRPIPAAILVIAFYLYWLLQLFYLTFLLVLAYVRLSLEATTDWMERLRAVDAASAGRSFDSRHGLWPWARSGFRPIPRPSGSLAEDPERKRGTGARGAPQVPHAREATSSWRSRLSLWIHQRTLETLPRSGNTPPPSQEIYHLVIIPVAKEAREVIEPGVESLTRQTCSTRNILVILALEARAPQEVQEGVRAIQHTYHDRFLDCLVSLHPDGLPGEARVKGANATYAAKEAARYFTAKGIPFERIIVSCFDADTVVSPQYMACLTYHFLVCPERTQASFQPIPVFHNNIWEATGFARVLDIGSSFFQLIEATDPEQLVTFSSHSMSFHALVAVDYWPVDLISDDSAIFWKALLHFEGRYRVVPLYMTLSMDMVHAGTWWKTAVNVYKQKRRWAWGVENFPLVMRGFLRATRIPLRQKIRHGVKLFKGHIEWATSGFILTIVGWLPALFAGREFSDSVVYYSAPRITVIVFRLASLTLVITIVLSLLFLPKTRVGFPVIRRVGHALEWLLIPLIATLFSALPALDAQTRLMLGKYMEFWVTEKERG